MSAAKRRVDRRRATSVGWDPDTFSSLKPMKRKHSASALKEMSLSGSLVGCEMRSFAANHSSVLDASNHMDYVEAFVLQIGEREQHQKILSLLASVDRAFSNGKIAYKPPGERLLTSVLGVGRWVSQRIYGGLAHKEVGSGTCGPTQRGPENS